MSAASGEIRLYDAKEGECYKLAKDGKYLGRFNGRRMQVDKRNMSAIYIYDFENDSILESFPIQKIIQVSCNLEVRRQNELATGKIWEAPLKKNGGKRKTRKARSRRHRNRK